MQVLVRAVLGVIVTLSLIVGPGLVLQADAAAAPVVTKVGGGAGPLRPTVVVIRGRHLGGVRAVRFGNAPAKLIARRGDHEVRVRTPRRTRPGSVRVQVRTASGWSRPTKRARYVFVAVPRVTGLSRTSGSFAGGQTMTIRGSALTTATQVVFGDRAAHITRRTARSVVVVTPVGALGSVPVRVTTRGGQARRRPAYTFTAPTTHEAARIVPGSNAEYEPGASVQWVSGGTDPDTGNPQPWIVSLAPGADVPPVGSGIVVPPGTAAYPSGLVGTVSDVAVQVDESTRVTVAPSDITSSVQEGHLAYAGPVVADPAARRLGTSGNTSKRTVAAGDSELESGSSIALTGPTSLFCHDQQGQSVSFGASLSLTADHQAVDTSLDWGGLFRKPRLKAAYSNQLTVSGTFSVDAAATCAIKPAWADAHRKIIPLGTSGATLSLGPSFTVTFTGKGTYSIGEVTRNTMLVDAQLGSSPSVTRVSRTVKSVHGGALSFHAQLAGGLSAQIGFLDRAGVEAKALLGVDVGVSARATQVCVEGTAFLRFGVGLFVDAFVSRWEAQIAQLTISLANVGGCSGAVGAETGSEPEIDSAVLPDATRGAPYSTTLTTADGTAGTWSLVGGQLPPGLSLDSGSGAVAGTPTTIGTYSADVRFVDDSGAAATSAVRIRVVPEPGVGGGDIQVQLRWTGPDDLDLHVTDPSGEEIWYDSPTSSSGGVLDHDANAGCNGVEDDDNAVENITWPTGESPRGTYHVWVQVYDQCEAASLDWHLTVRSSGRVVLDESGSGDSETYAVQGGSVGAAQSAPAARRIAPDRLPAKG